MPDRAVEITVPYRPPADLTRSVYAVMRSVYGPDVEIQLDVEQDKGLADVLPYVGVALGYSGKVVLDLVIEEAAKKIAILVRGLASGDGAAGAPPYEVRVTVAEHRLVYLFDEAARDDDRAAQAMLRGGLPLGARPGAWLRWDVEAGGWYPVPRP